VGLGGAITSNQSGFSSQERGPDGIINIWKRLLSLVRPWWGQLALTFFLGLAHHGAIIGLGVIGGLLLYEHRLVRADDLSKLDLAFFTMNGIISAVYFAFTLADLLILGEVVLWL
jgi:hypothetical protein